MTETERMYAYFICSIPMIGGVRAGQLLSRFGDPQGVYEAGTAGWREILSDSVVEYMDRQKKSGNLEEEYHSLGEKQIGLVLQEEEGFPQKLLEIPDPPYGLFYKGKLPEQKQPSVAVIGARECSEYGRFVAEELGRYLGSQGIQVISGMARGIDGISQQAALLAGGTSYGVLGCGVDICYHRQNRKLYEELIQKGGLLSKRTAGIFSPEEPYRQRVGGCVDRHRSQTEKWDVNYRGYGAGTGKGCVCCAGTHYGYL